MKLVLLGKPLSGKGTQAALLSRALDIPVLSFGALFRREVEKKSVLGKNVEEYMKKGKLVPNRFTFPLLQKYLPKKDFILDGFPRNLAQAKALEKMCSIDFVIDVHCSNRLIQKRIMARRSCPKCGKIYGLDVQPLTKGICACGARLIQRKDDTKAIVKKRLAVYTKQSAPLIAYYKHKKIYLQVSGEKNRYSLGKTILKKIS
ncbi:MAG: nucleoside monophosphate kinase [bacterium]|nr:nucleoside monophosphate kinase [bacterium]